MVSSNHSFNPLIRCHIWIAPPLPAGPGKTTTDVRKERIEELGQPKPSKIRSLQPAVVVRSRLGHHAVMPGGSFIAIWSADQNGRFRLYLSTYNPDLVPIKHDYAGGRRIATRVGDALYYLLADHLGSTTVVADAEGNEVGHVVYDPFGEIVERTLPPGVTDRLFTGQRYDRTIGLYESEAYPKGLSRPVLRPTARPIHPTR